MSDIFITVLIGVVSLNILITILMLSRPFLEKKMDMTHLNYLLKCVVVFSAVVAPVILCIISYNLNYHYRVYVPNPDFDYYEVLQHITIGNTYMRNHWIFLLLFVVWCTGIVEQGILKFSKDKMLLKKLEKYSKHSSDLKIIELKDRLCNELNIKNSISILSNDIIQSPFMVGVFKQKIFIPNADYAQSEWELLFTHELVHCKNHDFIFRRLVFVLCSLYWFNPFIYKLSDYFIEVNEMACDEKVLNHQPFNIHSMYATLIIDTHEDGNGLNAVSLTGHTVSGLEKRIKNIMKKNVKTKKLIFILLTMTIVLMCPFTTYAVSYGIAELQKWVVKNLVYKNVEVPVDEPAPIITEHFILGEIVKSPIQINDNKLLNMDINIEKGKLTDIGSVSISDNYIRGALSADLSSNSFNVGVITSNEEKIYAKSDGGSVYLILDKLQPGDYIVFIESTTEESIQ